MTTLAHDILEARKSLAKAVEDAEACGLHEVALELHRMFTSLGNAQAAA